MAFRQRKSSLRAPKLGNGKSLLSFFFPPSFTHAQDRKEDWYTPDGVRWANASGCRSHYKLGLVVGKAVGEPKYYFQG